MSFPYFALAQGCLLAMTSASGYPLFPYGPQALGLLLCKFNAGTGVVSDATQLSKTPNYGACFSPDNSKLYAGDGYLNQYEVSAFLSGGTVPAPVFVVNGVYMPKLYNDTIYLPKSGFWGNSLSRITNPSLLGTSCNVQTSFLFLQPGTKRGGSFSNDAIFPLPPDTIGEKVLDTLICINGAPGFDIRIAASSGYAAYAWNDGVTDSVRIITQRGTYWVLCKDDCHSRVDTFVIAGADAAFDLGADTTLCSLPSWELDATVADADRYLWNDDSTEPLRTASVKGSYWVQVHKSECLFADSVQLNFINVRQDLGVDTIICNEVPIQMRLSAQNPDGGAILWSNGSGDTLVDITGTGKYWVMVNQPPCVGTDTVWISRKLCDCTIQIPNAFSPNGDGLNDVFLPVVETGCLIKGYLLQVYNRWGQLVFQSAETTEDIGKGWNGNVNGHPADIGNYMYRLRLEAGTEGHIQIQKGDITLIR